MSQSPGVCLAVQLVTHEEEGRRGHDMTYLWCPGEVGMTGAALCVCICRMGCSWLLGKQYRDP